MRLIFSSSLVLLCAHLDDFSAQIAQQLSACQTTVTQHRPDQHNTLRKEEIGSAFCKLSERNTPFQISESLSICVCVAGRTEGSRQQSGHVQHSHSCQWTGRDRLGKGHRAAEEEEIQK